MVGMDWSEVAKYSIRVRPDMSTNVTHWTRRAGKLTAFDVLKKIIAERTIVASTPEGGYIKAGQRASCFTETPVTVMVRLFELAASDRNLAKFLKWEPYGLAFCKTVIYGPFWGRPVLYLNDVEYLDLVVKNKLESQFAWRVVKFHCLVPEQAVDFTHEREWRVPGDVTFDWRVPARPLAIVDKSDEQDELLAAYPEQETRPFRAVLCLHDLRAMG